MTLAELAGAPALAERAATFADLVLYDLALHSQRDNLGCTHGRSYMRFKATARSQTVFSALKLCFDRTTSRWPLDDGDEMELLPATEGATLLARCRRYRPPDIVRSARRRPAGAWLQAFLAAGVQRRSAATVVVRPGRRRP